MATRTSAGNGQQRRASRAKPATAAPRSRDAERGAGPPRQATRRLGGVLKSTALGAGAAAAGVALGAAAMRRRRPRRVLGMKMPAIGGGSPFKQANNTGQRLGRASKRVAATSKLVSRELDRFGDRAERIGELLD
jgi:hypothetical protein